MDPRHKYHLQIVSDNAQLNNSYLHVSSDGAHSLKIRASTYSTDDDNRLSILVVQPAAAKEGNDDDEDDGADAVTAVAKATTLKILETTGTAATTKDTETTSSSSSHPQTFLLGVMGSSGIGPWQLQGLSRLKPWGLGCTLHYQPWVLSRRDDDVKIRVSGAAAAAVDLLRLEDARIAGGNWYALPEELTTTEEGREGGGGGGGSRLWTIQWVVPLSWRSMSEVPGADAVEIGIRLARV